MKEVKIFCFGEPVVKFDFKYDRGIKTKFRGSMINYWYFDGINFLIGSDENKSS